ncbi:hypothetical protein N7326_01160 [Corynebacterium sp. ES2794-CONJ1]|uniref:hypothetical protein n=1 Tax=Corynebacterium sp. ES2794-CONJ1 TaxID=2980553 RepID=UPI0021DB7ADC|nr:hypothetical protein [Corynebacterium sp. ES2794-CONJ1]MCU9518478.1 hypothetical protein [Corynebacterium sp. ES2794-CONJ1]
MDNLYAAIAEAQLCAGLDFHASPIKKRMWSPTSLVDAEIDSAWTAQQGAGSAAPSPQLT